MAFSLLTELHSRILTSFQNISITPHRNSQSISSHSPFLLALRNHYSIFCLLGFTCLGHCVSTKSYRVMVPVTQHRVLEVLPFRCRPQRHDVNLEERWSLPSCSPPPRRRQRQKSHDTPIIHDSVKLRTKGCSKECVRVMRRSGLGRQQ